MKRSYLFVIAILISAVSFVFSATTVMALDEPETETTTQETTADAQKRQEQERQKLRENLAEQKQRAEEKAKQARGQAKKRACEAREKAITNIMNRAAERGSRHITLFTTIAERVEAFYTEKGKTLANYDQLVGEVTAKKAAAQSAVAATKAAASTFSCTSDNPKGMVESFKSTLRTQEEAIKAYRQAVKNLIVGVKSVQGAASRQEAGNEKTQ